MSSTLVSARVPENLAKRLEELSKTMHRSKSFLAAQAIEQNLFLLPRRLKNL
jgi:predicted transcriptional regulator